MLSSTRFTVAVHALSLLASSAGSGPVGSAIVARSVRTNPVVIRRIMRMLDRADLVRSTSGRSGGFELMRKAEEISLADIYLAVEEEAFFRRHNSNPKSHCPIGAQIIDVLAAPLGAAESALTGSLAKTKLSEVVAATA